MTLHSQSPSLCALEQLDQHFLQCDLGASRPKQTCCALHLRKVLIGPSPPQTWSRFLQEQCAMKARCPSREVNSTWVDCRPKYLILCRRQGTGLAVPFAGARPSQRLLPSRLCCSSPIFEKTGSQGLCSCCSGRQDTTFLEAKNRLVSAELMNSFTTSCCPLTPPHPISA